MNSYVMIILADILLASTLGLQRKYKDKAGVSPRASLIFTIYTSGFSAILFFVINKLTISITMFSVIMAVLFASMLTFYVFIGFCIMKRGNMSLYTLFLMSGGMTIPYIYGVLFLNEELNILRILGLLFIVAAVTVNNFGKDKADRKQIALCITVFILNGLVSVISKAHQISAASEVVSSPEFVFLATVSKFVISILVLPFIKKEETDKPAFSSKSVVLIFIMAAVTDGISYMLQLMGAVEIPATVLYPLITGGTIIFSVLVDLLVFKEKIALKQWIGTGIAFLGTLMFL